MFRCFYTSKHFMEYNISAHNTQIYNCKYKIVHSFENILWMSHLSYTDNFTYVHPFVRICYLDRCFLKVVFASIDLNIRKA